MNPAWRDITFGDVFKITSSKRVLQKQWQSEGVPFYRAREIVKLSKDGTVESDLFISEDLFSEFKSRYGVPEPGDLMVSAVGTLGACYVVQPQDRFYFKDASVLRFSPKEAIDSRFIQHAFRTNQILKQIKSGSGSTVGTYTISRAKKTKIPLPPLAEQKRIAGILDAADALRAKRRESLAQLDTLLQSTFLEMFGDPVTNPMGWEVEKLAKVTSFSQGIQIGLESHKEIQAEGLSRFLRISDFTKEGCEPRYVPTPSKRYHASADEVIMIRYGEAGRVVRGLDGFIANNLFKISPIEDNFHNTYLFYFLGSPRIADRIKSTSAITSMPQVSHKTVGQLLTPIPPIPLQHRFAAIVESVEQQKASQRAHLEELDTLFASLQSRAFQGEL